MVGEEEEKEEKDYTGLWGNIAGAVGSIVNTGMTAFNKDYQKSQVAIAEAEAREAEANALSAKAGGLSTKMVIGGVIGIIAIILLFTLLKKSKA
ncbi:MAG: hypothetical protein HYU67_04620 [Flavobacteriia bacterium]|nr:hypothetical protein [Flavobacteriia bacterium]